MRSLRSLRLRRDEFVTGRKVFLRRDSAALRHVIDEAYAKLERGEEYYVGPHAPADT
jgi:hypothetical protein